MSSKSPVLKVACPQSRVLNVAVLNFACPQCPIGPETVDVSSHNRVYTIPVFEDANAMYMRNSLGNRQCMLFAQSRGRAINANGNEYIRKAV